MRKLHFEIKFADLRVCVCVCVCVCVYVCVNYLSTRLEGAQIKFETNLKFIEVVTATASPFSASTDICVVP